MLARPSSFDVLLDLAHAMWAPVFRELSQEDFARLADLPYDEALYHDPGDPGWEVFATIDTRETARTTRAARRAITWVSPEQVDLIHNQLINAFGGEPGIRTPGQVAGYIDRAQNSLIHDYDPFPTIFDKAAHLMRMILTGHPYVDGQKRTGLATAFVFLGLNGYALWARKQMDEVHFAIKVAQGEKDNDEVSEWLRKRVGPLRIGRGSTNLAKVLGGMVNTQPRCFECTLYVKVIGMKAVCQKCNLVYELTARAVGFATGLDGEHIEARIGLHKIGEGIEVVRSVMPVPLLPRLRQAVLGDYYPELHLPTN